MKKRKQQIEKTTVVVPLLMVGLMWFIFLIQKTGLFNQCYGVIPWKMEGLRGIVLSPLFHGNLEHIMSNSIPMLILSFVLFLFYNKQAYFVIISSWILTGLATWLLPDFSYFQSGIYSCHIGASGVIYALAFFLFFSGVFSKKLLLLVVSIVVFLVYGSIVYGIFPSQVDQGVSWQGHLMGAIVGSVIAYKLNKR